MRGDDETSPPLNPAIRALARIISVITHPGFIPFYFLIPWSMNKSHQFPILAGSFLLLVFLPLAGTVIYLRRMRVKDLYTVERTRRFVPFGLHALGIGIFWLIMNSFLNGYLPSRWIAFVFLFNLLGFFITLFWKISLHMMGIGAISGLAIALGLAQIPSGYVVLLASLVLVIAWARMYLRSHDIWQILAGFATGSVSIYFAWIYWLS